MLTATQVYDDIKISEEALEPQQKDGEVIVTVRAAGVNFVDLLYVSTIKIDSLERRGHGLANPVLHCSAKWDENRSWLPSSDFAAANFDRQAEDFLTPFKILS